MYTKNKRQLLKHLSLVGVIGKMLMLNYKITRQVILVQPEIEAPRMPVEDEFARRGKRQVIEDFLGTVGDIAVDVTLFDSGYDGMISIRNNGIGS